MKTKVVDLFIFELNGVIGSGIIGFNSYYDISDKNVEIEAYTKLTIHLIIHLEKNLIKN